MARRLQTVAAVTCMKLLLLIFNVIFWLAGIILLAFGLWMKISLHSILELSDQYNEVVPYVFIGTGCVILIAGFFACCCTVKGQPVLLYILSAFLLLVFLLEITAGITGYVYRGRIEKGFKSGLNSSLETYGRGGMPDKDVDIMQKYLKCCGVEDYSDWFRKWGNQSVPISCCKDEKSCNHDQLEDPTQIYTEGCYFKVIDFLNNNLGAIFGGAVALAFFQLIGVMLACCLAKHADKAKYEQVA